MTMKGPRPNIGALNQYRFDNHHFSQKGAAKHAKLERLNNLVVPRLQKSGTCGYDDFGISTDILMTLWSKASTTGSWEAARLSALRGKG